MTNLTYFNNNTEFIGRDALGNDIDFNYDPSFFLKLI